MAFGCRIEYVEDRHPTRLYRIRNECTVTPPRHCLGAHDRALAFRGVQEQTFQRRFELWGLHVIGVGPEARVPPLHVRRVGTPLSPAAQLGKMCVSDGGGRECFLEAVLREVGIAP